MHTVLVKYVLPQPVPRSKMIEGFKQAEDKFRNTPKLIRKYFSYDEANHTGHSVYLWESEADARAFFNEIFIEGFKTKFGTIPELYYVETLQVVDNEQGKTTYA